MTLKSNPNELNISDENLFDKLIDINNFQKIMPENISKFEIIDSNTLIFSLKGMPEIKLIFGEKKSPSLIILNSIESKISFSLSALINKNCSFILEFNGDLNPMIQMMVKTPLQTFINDISKNTSSLIS
jgi:hypothetical protein